MTNSIEPVSIFCAITHGLYRPWIDILHEGQTPTWLSNKPIPNFQVHHFHGIPGGSAVIKFDRIHERIRWTNRWVATPLRITDHFFGAPFRSYIPNMASSKRLNLRDPATQINFLDIYATMKWKDLGIFDYFIKNSDADYLFMTTTSSYLRPLKLLSLAATLPRNRLYAGAVAYSGANFAAGNNRLFSRDVVEAIISSRRNLSSGIIEDLALGNLCSELGIDLYELPKLNISSMRELAGLSDKEITANYHFRLKSGTIEHRNDVEIMTELHRRVRIIDGL